MILIAGFRKIADLHRKNVRKSRFRYISQVHVNATMSALKFLISHRKLIRKSTEGSILPRLTDDALKSLVQLNTGTAHTNIRWRGRGGGLPTSSAVDFDRRLDKISIWLERWSHQEVRFVFVTSIFFTFMPIFVIFGFFFRCVFALTLSNTEDLNIWSTRKEGGGVECVSSCVAVSI